MSNALKFSYEGDARIHYITPVDIPVSGGTVVNVYGVTTSSNDLKVYLVQMGSMVNQRPHTLTQIDYGVSTCFE